MVSPEGAITIARTLLETVCKRILDQIPARHTQTRKIYRKLLPGMTSKALNLAQTSIRRNR